jgi:hypothetical protein
VQPALQGVLLESRDPLPTQAHRHGAAAAAQSDQPRKGGDTDEGGREHGGNDEGRGIDAEGDDLALGRRAGFEDDSKHEADRQRYGAGGDGKGAEQPLRAVACGRLASEKVHTRARLGANQPGLRS